MTVFWAAILTGILLTLLFCVSLTCFSLRTYSRSRLDELCDKNGNRSRFLDVLKNWERTLIASEAVLIIVALATVCVVIAGSQLLLPGDPRPSTGVDWFNAAMKWLGTAGLLILVGLVGPRSLARVSGERFIYRFWPIIQSVAVIVSPVVRTAMWCDKILHRLYGIDEVDPSDPETLADEIRTVVDAGELLGAIHPHAGSMIDQVMDLKNADVASVMTPRTEMGCIRAAMTAAEARNAVLEAGHTRMPVIGSSTDDIIGILYAKDLLRYVDQDEESATSVALSDICREAFYVPETTSVDRLLETMNRKRVHMAVVLDEYGGVAGVVTMEDILEEIVGEIVDEYDEEETDPIRRVSDTVNELDARVHIDDLVEEFGYDLPEDRDFDTIGGFVFSHLGRIPEQDESFEWGTLRLTVLEVNERRVLKLRIEHDESLSQVTRDT